MNIPRQLPLKQIRKQCLYCCCGSVKTIRFCHSIGCPLWYSRFGKFLKSAIKEHGMKSFFYKENFKKGAQFCQIEELKRRLVVHESKKLNI